MKIIPIDSYSRIKLALVAVSIALNVFGNTWGAPATWHPDEITRGAAHMVRTFDPNPHAYPYGGLHYYVVAGFAVAPVAALARIASAAGLIDATDGPLRDWTLKWTMVAARTISALMTAATVAVTIEIGARLFSRAAGFAGGTLLLAAPGSVVNAHYATVDAAGIFWYWLACLGSLSIWKTGKRGAYLFSGIAAGLAIGTKIDRALVLVPLVAGHLLRGRSGRHRDLLAAIGLTTLAFLGSNPFIVTAPFEFLDGLTRDQMFNALTPTTDLPIHEFAISLQTSLGTPLLLLLAAGIALGIFLLLLERRHRELVWVAATSLPIVALYSVAASTDRYVMLLVPGMALLAGYSAATLLSSGEIWRRLLAGLPLAGVLAWSLLTCLAMDRIFVLDPRYTAAEWLDRHAAAGARVAMDGRGPWLRRDRYRVSLLEPDHEVQEEEVTTRERLRQCDSCERVRNAIFAAERWVASALGRSPTRQPYKAWFDIEAERIASEGSRPDDLTDADYVLLLLYRKPVTAKRLGAAGSGYELAARFPTPEPFGIKSEFSLLGRPVAIYARKAP